MTWTLPKHTGPKLDPNAKPTGDYPFPTEKGIIQDGDNVESQEFEAGFGGTAKASEAKPAKPYRFKKLSAQEKKQRDWFYMTEDENRRIEAAHLEKYGINF